jgi:hypothetical protein
MYLSNSSLVAGTAVELLQSEQALGPTRWSEDDIKMNVLYISYCYEIHMLITTFKKPTLKDCI